MATKSKKEEDSDKIAYAHKKVLTLEDKLTELSLVVINGANYLAKVESNETDIKIKDSILIIKSEFEEVIKDWIRKSNSGDLQDITLLGSNNSLAVKPFSSDQLHTIKLVAIKAEYAMSKALIELQNSKI